jgi:hypothetical protein
MHDLSERLKAKDSSKRLRAIQAYYLSLIAKHNAPSLKMYSIFYNFHVVVSLSMIH